MNTKRLIVLLMTMVFTLGVEGLSFSAQAQGQAQAQAAQAQEIKGKVSRIDGNMLTILDDMNKEKTVKVKDKDLESLKAIKVGDRVLVRDGTVTKGGT